MLFGMTITYLSVGCVNTLACATEVYTVIPR